MIHAETNYKLIIHTLEIFLAWEAGELSEGQVVQAFNGMPIVEARGLKAEAIRLGALNAQVEIERGKADTGERRRNSNE